MIERKEIERVDRLIRFRELKVSIVTECQWEAGGRGTTSSSSFRSPFCPFFFSFIHFL